MDWVNIEFINHSSKNRSLNIGLLTNWFYRSIFVINYFILYNKNENYIYDKSYNFLQPENEFRYIVCSRLEKKCLIEWHTQNVHN